MKNSGILRTPDLSNPRTLVFSSLLVALSIVFGKYLAFNFAMTIRISFENLPILIAGIFFGPVIGMAVAAVADVLGCVLAGYAINPIITAGAIAVGFLSGFIFRSMKGGLTLKLAFSIGVAHIVGSMIIKTFGIYVYYHAAVPLLMMRIPTYIIISAAEFCIVRLLFANKAFRQLIEGYNR